MQKHNNIKALFFLGIFSMLMLHQVLPHWHHEHDVEHTHKAVAHSDNYSHDHDVPEKEIPYKGFLDLFLEMHVNITVSSEILLTHTSSVKQLIVKTYKSAPASVNYYTVFVNYDEVEKIRVYHPPNNYFNSYLSSLDSRGPPSLG
ncbi:hypothetical protein [Lutibacter sp.]|uniref:hypothetical protein n=1 Tax=Lutibacter sp. TaxID=1925666 RepID=UPI001A2DAE68|nr:hypothetical protein [Lutibacter sp.]MBI9040243.1 hypothetical protein [Lutibacter sp.]